MGAGRIFSQPVVPVYGEMMNRRNALLGIAAIPVTSLMCQSQQIHFKTALKRMKAAGDQIFSLVWHPEFDEERDITVLPNAQMGIRRAQFLIRKAAEQEFGMLPKQIVVYRGKDWDRKIPLLTASIQFQDTSVTFNFERRDT